MEIKLHKATVADCEKIHEMQVLSFKALLDKYNDILTNPGAETLEQVQGRMGQENTDYYLIELQQEKIGAIRVVRQQENICRISPMFLLPEFQGRGFAQQALKAVESLYPQTDKWRLDTIKEEAMLCHLYEKMGYRQTGNEEKIQDNMTIVYYEK